MTLIPNWQDQDLTCALCGSKQSVKYKIKIFIIDNFPSDEKTEREVCACNRCALTLTTPIESRRKRYESKEVRE